MSKPAIDFASPTWHAIQTLAAQKVAQLREQNDSPALDAGDSAADSGLTDLYGNGRIVGKAMDIGAVERQ